MSVRQLTQQIESFCDRLNILQQQLGELPQTVAQSEQLEQTFAVLHAGVERLIADLTTQPPTDERLTRDKYELQAVFDETLDAMLIADDAGSYVDANPAACELLGVSKEEILTRSIADFTEPSVDFSQAWQQFVEKGRVRGEFRILRPDGTVRETEYAAVANFVPHRHLAILRDITERNQIAKELLNKQRLIDQIAESMPAILYVYDLCEQRNVYANGYLTEVLGLSPETAQAMGTALLPTLIYPDDGVKVAEANQQLAIARDGEVVEIEYRMHHACGEWIWLYGRSVVLTRNADGSPRQILGTATDITRLKQTEQELRQSQAKYRALSEVLEQRVQERTAELTQINQKLIREISDRKQVEIALRQSEEQLRLITDSLPVCISYIDREQRYRFVNKTYEVWFGYKREQIYGRTLREFVGEAGYTAIEKYLKRVLAGETVFFESELPHHLWASRRYIFGILVPDFDAQSQFRGCYALITDITERKQAEMQLLQTRNFMQSVLDHLPIGVFAKDPKNLRYVLWNPAYTQLMGYTAEEALGKTDYELFVKQQADFCTNQDRKVLACRQMIECPEELILTNQGEPKIIRNKKVAVCDGFGNPEFLLGFAEDITEGKQAQDRLRASLLEKEVLLAEIHHRVKNNLSVICSLLELQIDQVSDPQAKTALQESCNRVSSMALVHENLIWVPNRDSYSKAAATKNVIPHSVALDVFNPNENRYNDFSRVYFAEYAQQLVGDLLVTYESSASKVMLNFDGDSVSLSLDQAIPCGLLLNELITNALKHGLNSGCSGHLYIRLTKLADDWIELSVGNDGDRLPNDFDLERNASMGLRLVMMFVEQLTGRLELERGEITWFKVQFPQNNIQ